MATELTSDNKEQTALYASSNAIQENDAGSTSINGSDLTVVTRTLSEDIFVLTFSAWSDPQIQVPKAGYMILLVLLAQCFAVVVLIGSYESEDHFPGVIKYDVTSSLELNGAKVNNFLLTNNATISIYGGRLFLKETDDVPGSRFSLIMWCCGMVSSVFILFIYILQEAYGHILLFYVPDYIHSFAENKRIIKVVCVVNLILVYLSWILGVRYVFYYSGDAYPTNVILVPIGIVFILEVDEWAAKLFILHYDDITRHEIFSNLCVIKTTKEHVKLCKIGWKCFLANCVCPAILYPPISLIWRKIDASYGFGFQDQPNSDTFIYGWFSYICYASTVVSWIYWYFKSKKL